MEETAAYQAALDYIYSFIDYSMTRALRYSPEKFDLGRMNALLEFMGNPQRSYPVLHVAGTKGKGSVAALMASSLRSAGYRTGLYTSPHLQDYVERMQIDGQAVSANEFVDLVEAIKPVVQEVEHLTTFEITTALAFEYF
ncbi:MAG TPA: hypothetical protein VHO48_12760, partial [Anaerolineaceae bacterium]|nr:hypothetical protein [Anaerolineaceae bacterium]